MQVHVDERPERSHELKFTAHFDPAGLRISHSLIGVRVELEGCVTTGTPGAPALPSRVVHVALPRGTRAVEVSAEPRQAQPISGEAVPLAPIQPTRAGVTKKKDAGTPYMRPDESKWQGRRRCVRIEDPCAPSAIAFAVPDYVAPDPALYRSLPAEAPARLLATELSGLTPIAAIALRPVQVTKDGRLELVSELIVSVRHERADDQGLDVPPHIVSRGQALRDIALTKTVVINPRSVIDYKHHFPIELFVKADYLIITDNNRWDPATQTALGPAGGDVVASFERLAAWKRQRGLNAMVATITDIVGGTWGDYRTGSRDLQETLRKFLKMAQSKWGVAWVLLGGDTPIIPVRYAAGGREGEVTRQTVDPPPENTSVWSTNHLRIHAVSPGTWWGASAANRLVRTDDGRSIPYDSAGTSSTTVAGWFFTTDDTYSMRSAVATDFVRVNGPASLVNADLRFLYFWNLIPTDLYYSSLVGPNYNQAGRHDWDLLDNEIYGQSTASAELDGINYTPTVSLGRVPANDSAQADAFVDKVVAYEKFEAPDGTPLDTRWPGKAVIVSENWDWNWGGRNWITNGGSTPPDPGRYYYDAASNRTIIQLNAVPDWDWSLLSLVTDDDVRVLPYRTDAATAGRGWYFATSATNFTPRHALVSTGTKLIYLPLPSRWIAVFGPEIEINPHRNFIFNSTQLDGSLADQEELRLLLSMKTGYGPALRLYDDVQDMTPSQVSAGPLAVLSQASLRDALNGGPHIVSLSGHGSSDGCCKLDRWTAADLTNGFHSFIAYADSCLTSQFDAPAMGEALVANSRGGAVAYMGNTRFSWISVGDDIQRAFFERWATLGKDAHLGLLADTRAGLVNNFWWADGRWTVLALNLLGCPEMPLWWRRPGLLKLPPLQVNDRIRFELEHPDPPDPPFDDLNPYAEDWDVVRVHVWQGDHEQVMAFRGSSVDMRLKGFRPGPARVTVARSGSQPVVREIRIGSGTRRATASGGSK